MASVCSKHTLLKLPNSHTDMNRQ